MSIPPSIMIHSVTVAKIAKNTISIPITVKTQSGESVETLAMIDSGAGGKFINQNFAKKFKTKKLNTPIRVYNVDRTENKEGTIKYFVDLEFQTKEKQFTERLLVSGLGKQKIILGLPWLTKHNPMIDWKTGAMTWEDVLERQK